MSSAAATVLTLASPRMTASWRPWRGCSASAGGDDGTVMMWAPNGVVLDALVDADQIADEPDGAADVLVVAANVAVALERGQHVVDEAGGGLVIVGHGRLFRWWR